jgi:hypothetical protein
LYRCASQSAGFETAADGSATTDEDGVVSTSSTDGIAVDPEHVVRG